MINFVEKLLERSFNNSSPIGAVVFVDLLNLLDKLTIERPDRLILIRGILRQWFILLNRLGPGDDRSEIHEVNVGE